MLLATAVVMPNANSVAPDQPAHPQSDLSYTVHLSISNTLFVEIIDSVALRSDCLDVQYDMLLSYGRKFSTVKQLLMSNCLTCNVPRLNDDKRRIDWCWHQ